MSTPDVPAKPPPSELEMLHLLQMMHAADLIHTAFSGSGKELVLAAPRGQVGKKARQDIQQILNGEQRGK